MRFASVGSGSQGNGLVVDAGASRVLLDCGFSVRETLRRLSRLGLAADDLSGIIVTHEHDDHAGGIFALARRYGLQVWMTHGTLSALRESDAEADRGVSVALIRGEGAFAIGDIEVLPFTVPHDAREPVQFALSDGSHRLGVLTDAGCSTPHLEKVLSGCDALVLETNHDAGMLSAGEYPPALKARISGRYGHLDNASSAAILAAIDRSRLQHVIAAHLSQQNNTAQLARAALASVLCCAAEWVGVASQEDGFGWRDIV